MQYSFEILEKKDSLFKVSACIIHSGDEIFKDVIYARYDYNIGIVLLDLAQIETKIPDNQIRREFVSKIKTYIKQSI